MVFDSFIIKCSTFLKLQTADWTHMSFLQLQRNGFRYSIQSEGKTFNILQCCGCSLTRIYFWITERLLFQQRKTICKVNAPKWKQFCCNCNIIYKNVIIFALWVLNYRIALHKQLNCTTPPLPTHAGSLVAMTFSNPNKIMPIRSISLWMTAQGHGVYVSTGLEALIHHFDSFFWFLLITFVVIQVVETSIKLNRKHLTSLKYMLLLFVYSCCFPVFLLCLQWRSICIYLLICARQLIVFW